MFGMQIFYDVLIFVYSVMFFKCGVFSFEILVSQLVVLSTPHSNALLVQKFLQHLSNRACRTIVYDHYLPQKLPHVRCVRDPRRLPLNDVQVLCAFVIFLAPNLFSDLRKGRNIRG